MFDENGEVVRQVEGTDENQVKSIEDADEDKKPIQETEPPAPPKSKEEKKND